MPPTPAVALPRLSGELRDRVGRLRWRGHCIRLDDETSTMPGVPALVDTPRYRAVEALLATLLPGGVAGRRVADLGCFEGGFSLALAQQGADVVGVEARPANMAKLRVVEDHFRLPNLAFVEADVKDFALERFGRFDAVLALGILYHLDDPVRWLRQVAAVAPLLVVDTHVAPEDDALATSEFAPRLGPIETVAVDGATYEGRWFREFSSPDVDRGPRVLASWSNDRSFWLRAGALRRALLAAGYTAAVTYDDAFTLDLWRPRARLLVGAVQPP